MPIFPLPHVYLITDRKLAASETDFLDKIEQALAAGIRMVQLREKDLPPAELFQLGQTLRTLTHRFGASLLINDRLDLALALNADGVHLPENAIPTAVARRLLGANKLVGVSTHRMEQIKKHAEAGADFVTFSPIYATASKAAYGAPQGLVALEKACQEGSLPVYALGGITFERATECRDAGAFGVAVVSAILASSNPFQATQDLISRF